MSTESPQEPFNQTEMARYGFDPSNQADRQEWLRTTPPAGTPEVPNYSEDAYAFGSMQPNSLVELSAGRKVAAGAAAALALGSAVALSYDFVEGVAALARGIH